MKFFSCHKVILQRTDYFIGIIFIIVQKSRIKPLNSDILIGVFANLIFDNVPLKIK